MDIEEALVIVDKIIQPETLTTLQELVFRECWLGKTYQEIAKNYDYDANYMRAIGSHIWQLLSEAYQEDVSKNNFRNVLEEDRSKKVLELFNIEFPDGIIPINSSFYIDRPPLEKNCAQEIISPGALLCIKAGQKMGKTSLLNRVLNILSPEYCAIKIDLQQADKNILEDFNKLLRWLLANICFQLKIKNSIDYYWDEDLGVKVNCTTYLERRILALINKPLVLAIDRLEIIFNHTEVALEFLSLLNFWHEEAKSSSIWQKLHIITVQSTESYLLPNYYQSFFDGGVSITLQKFNQQQILDLAERYQLLQNNRVQKDEIKTLNNLIDGHPYLARLALDKSAKYNLNLTKLLAEAATETSIFIDILRYYLKTLYDNIALAQAFKQVVLSATPVQLESWTAYQLENLGLITLQGNEATPSCQLYRLYFKDRLYQF